MNTKESIDAERKGFEDSFSSGVFYNKQTQDAGHLEQILRFLQIKQEMTIPDIEYSIGEVSRVLKKNGSFFVSDPCPNDCDSSRFVDEYMQMKKDGHIKFYTKKEWENICGKFGMAMSDFFESSIRFPRKRDTAYGFDELLKKHEQSIIDSYDLVVTDTEIYVTERVKNILFLSQSGNITTSISGT